MELRRFDIGVRVNIMALLNDILSWATTSLTDWQRDALRRLFQQEELTTLDYDDLYAMMKASHGIPDPQNRLPIPLTAKHLPGTIIGQEVIILKAMRDLHYVNRIATNQTLTFADKGMTVIYGGNGSGKSGYSRVLKRACRARDQAETVLTDATDPSANDKIPEAIFDIAIGGTTKSLKWIRGTASPDELSTIAVFDVHCARSYLSEGEVAYLPYGLDVVENLANKVISVLSQRVNQEIASVNVDVTPFNYLLGETAVGKLVANLSENTNPDNIKALATLSKEETTRIAELERALSETDPKAKAQELRLSAGRLKELLKRLDAAFAWVKDETVGRVRALDEKVVTSAEAEKIAADAFRSVDKLLPGTGEPVWKTLFEAARKFSAEVAYRGCPFPHTGKGAVCPLCQQRLTDGGDRLNRFDKYIKEDTTKVATETRQQLEAVRAKIEGANLSIGLDDSLVAELDLLDLTLVPIIRAFETSFAARRSAMLNAIDTHSWINLSILSDNPRQKLRNLTAHQLKSVRMFENAIDESQKLSLTVELKELQARQKLAVNVDAIVKLTDRMRSKNTLEKCNKDLNTRFISDKSRELASTVITASLKSTLDDEFKILGIGHIKTKLSQRTERGKILYSLLLDLPTTNKLEDILSEGEQRAIAIGSFLAELRIANHTGGIVFDDPVSSLDHWRRQHVAKRLVEEADRRQVIIFTHDTSFLGQLRDEIDARNTQHVMEFLEWKDKPGYVHTGLPWGHKSYAERIDYLEKAQRILERRPWPTYPNEAECGEMTHLYDLLRATIERVIQDVVFNGVVQRYRDWIHVSNLDKVVGFTDTEYSEIFRLYQLCNKVIDAHDPSSAKNLAVPTATEFGKDIEDLKTVIEVIKARRKHLSFATIAASK